MAGEAGALFVRVGADLSGFSKGMLAAQAQMKGAASRMKGMGAAMAANAASGADLFRATTTARVATERAAKGALMAGAGFGTATVQTSAFSRAMTAASVQAQALGAKLVAMGPAMVATGTKMTKFLSLPIIAGFGAAVKVAADFESSLNSMQAVSGATGAEMKLVSRQAKLLGADIRLPGASASDAAQAMTELVKGNLSVKESMAAARGTLLLATAAQIGNAEAATITADALNAFGLKGKDAGKVADLLAASANVSTAEIGDMALGLQQSSAVAKMFDVSIQDTVTALALLANAGIKGSDAGTSLKTMFMRLGAPVGAGAKAIAKYGIALRDQHGALKPLPALAAEFGSKIGTLPKVQRDAAMAAIFGSDAIRAGNILLMHGADAHKNMKEKVTEHGAAQKVAAGKMEGFKGALDAFKSTLETAAISIGTMLLPMLTGLVGKLTGVVSWFEGLPGPVKQAIAGFLGVVAVAGPLLLIIGKFIAIAGVMKTAIMGIGVALKFAAANPIVLVIAGLVALGAALLIAWKKSETFRSVVTGVFNAVKSAAQAFAGFFTSTLPAAFNAVLGAARGAFNAIVGAVTGAMNRVVGAVRAVLGAMAAAGRAIGEAVWNGLKVALGALSRVGQLIIDKVSGAISAAAQWALGAAAAIGRAIMEGIASGLRSLAGWLGDQLISAVAPALGAVKKRLGIGSPSRVFAEEVGRPIMEGIALGMTQSLSIVDRAVSRVASRIKERADAARGVLATAFQRMASFAFRAFDDETRRGLDSISRTFAGRFAAIDAFRGALTPAEAEIQKIEDARGAARILESIADAESALVKAQSEGDPAAILAAQRSLDDAKLEQRLAALRTQATTERTERDKMAETQREQLDTQLADAVRVYEAERDIRRTNLEGQLAETERKFAEGKTIASTALGEILGILGAYGIDFKQAGASLGDMFLTGFGQSLGGVAAVTGTINAAPTSAGKAPNLIRAFAHGGIVTSPTLGLVGEAGPEAVIPLSDMGSFRGRAGAGSGGGGTTTINLTVVDQTFAGMSRDQVRRVAVQLEGELVRNAYGIGGRRLATTGG